MRYSPREETVMFSLDLKKVYLVNDIQGKGWQNPDQDVREETGHRKLIVIVTGRSMDGRKSMYGQWWDIKKAREMLKDNKKSLDRLIEEVERVRQLV